MGDIALAEEENEDSSAPDTASIENLFVLLMSWLYQQRNFTPEMLTAEEVQRFINAHTEYLNKAVETALAEVALDDISVQRLKESNYVFSGIKTFHELNEAFPSLIDSEGNLIPFNQFLNSVQTINKSYNVNYLKAEYEFAKSCAYMAAKWREIEQLGDDYNVQYRTAGDARVRETHQPLHGITLPIKSRFWDKYCPPNGWRCRCTIIPVRKDKYPLSDETQAMNLGSQATAGKHQEMFMFNPGKAMTTFPAYNAYTRKACIECPYSGGSIKLAKVPDNELCQACKVVREMANNVKYIEDEEFGGRLRVSVKADKTEVNENTIAAKALLRSFPDMNVVIREHVIKEGVKNPEYLINGVLADRKGIESENGVAAGFNKAIKQGCGIVVIDLDKNADKFPILRTRKLSSSINNRHTDFENGTITECYVIFNGKAVRIGKELFGKNAVNTKENICNVLEKIKGDRSLP